jgi:hypothetical protein
MAFWFRIALAYITVAVVYRGRLAMKAFANA